MSLFPEFADCCDRSLVKKDTKAIQDIKDQLSYREDKIEELQMEINDIEFEIDDLQAELDQLKKVTEFVGVPEVIWLKFIKWVESRCSGPVIDMLEKYRTGQKPDLRYDLPQISALKHEWLNFEIMNRMEVAS